MIYPVFGSGQSVSDNGRYDFRRPQANAKSSESVSNPEVKPKKKRVGGAAFATALSAVALTGGVIAGKKFGTKALRKSVKNLTQKNGELNDLNTRLQGEIASLKTRLADLLNTEPSTPSEKLEINRLVDELRAKIDKSELGYDIEHPPVNGVKPYKKTEGAINYEGVQIGTRKRADMTSLDIPEVTPEGQFDFTLPSGSETITHGKDSKGFTLFRKNVSTSISESYADSVQWDNDKIVRDILQNFFDGHGQTLDGVRIITEPVGSTGRIRVRIEGKSTYTPDKAVFLGESTKRSDANAAGNYGEGIKMAALKLLRDKGADAVKIGSDYWDLTYKLRGSELSKKRVLAYSLKKRFSRPTDGNYLEFETTDRGLIDSLRDTINRFYHSHNIHFKDPEFENAHFGIKVLPNKTDKGALYIAGQRFEYNGNYDGLQGVNLFLKKKPPVNVLDPSRDRTSINESQLRAIAQWLAMDCTTKMEKLQVLKTLEPWMDKLSKDSPMDAFVERFACYCDSGGNFLHASSVNFPENYVHYSNCSTEMLQGLISQGYKVCKDDLHYAGMRSLHELVGDASNHDVVAPDEISKKKILILKDALKRLTSLEGTHFTPEELDTKIYLFNANGAKESSMNKGTLAEAIIENGRSKGFWIDKSYLDSASFADTLETALHELSHKAGGDESSNFSYKLTDVNRDTIKQLLNNPEIHRELQALAQIWESLSVAA